MLGKLFISFFKIGSFTIGGGYAMIPLMQKEIVDRHHWMSEELFLDQIALSQAMPGVFAVNMAASIGYRLKGWRGAVCAIVGNILISIILILLLAIFFHQFKDNVIINNIFKGLRPAVAALIAAPVFNMARTAKITWSNCWIPIGSALLIWLCGVSPILIILSAIVGGLLFYILKKR